MSRHARPIFTLILCSLSPACVGWAGPAPEPGCTWRNAGPGGGGWIQSVAFDPRDPHTIHLGCDVGGYYRSTDGGQTFRVHNDGLRDYFIEDLLVDHADPRTLYVATPSGVHKSSDGGDSWTLKRSGLPEPNQHAYAAPIGRIVMDPNDPRILYAGVGRPRMNTYGRGHVYRSTDGAESWRLLDGIAAHAPEAVIHQLAIHPRRSNILFAATDRGLFKSADAGVTWTILENGLPHRFCRSVAIHPTHPDTLYAVLWSTPGVKPWQGGVYRSDDGGDTWSARNDGLPQKVAPPGDAPQKTCNFIRFIADPRDPARIFVGADSWWNAGLYRSHDGGRNWEFITRTAHGTGERPNVEPGWLTSWGLSVKCISLSPVRPDSILFGTSGVILRTDDGGDSWHQQYTAEAAPGRWRGNGLEVTCLDQIAVDPFQARKLYCGYADIGLMTSDDGGDTWSRASDGLPQRGDMAQVVCDPKRPGVAWCTEGKVASGKGCVAKTTDGARTWTVVGSSASGLPQAATRFLALDPTSPTDRRTLYVHSHGHGIYKSTDDGASWTPASAGLGDNAALGDLALDPTDPRRLYASVNAADTGGIFVSTDAAASWHRIHAPTRFLDVRRIAIDPRDARTLFVACRERYDHASRKLFAGGVFKSADAGRSWTRVLDDRFASCIRFSPHRPGTICVGTTDHPYFDFATGRGLSLSRDGGATWQPINHGLSVLQIGTVEFDPGDPNRLYTGTNGNGLFVGTLR